MKRNIRMWKWCLEQNVEDDPQPDRDELVPPSDQNDFTIEDIIEVHRPEDWDDVESHQQTPVLTASEEPGEPVSDSQQSLYTDTESAESAPVEQQQQTSVQAQAGSSNLEKEKKEQKDREPNQVAREMCTQLEYQEWANEPRTSSWCQEVENEARRTQNQAQNLLNYDEEDSYAGARANPCQSHMDQRNRREIEGEASGTQSQARDPQDYNEEDWYVGELDVDSPPRGNQRSRREAEGEARGSHDQAQNPRGFDEEDWYIGENCAHYQPRESRRNPRREEHEATQMQNRQNYEDDDWNFARRSAHSQPTQEIRRSRRREEHEATQMQNRQNYEDDDWNFARRSTHSQPQESRRSRRRAEREATRMQNRQNCEDWNLAGSSAHSQPQQNQGIRERAERGVRATYNHVQEMQRYEECTLYVGENGGYLQPHGDHRHRRGKRKSRYRRRRGQVQSPGQVQEDNEDKDDDNSGSIHRMRLRLYRNERLYASMMESTQEGPAATGEGCTHDALEANFQRNLMFSPNDSGRKCDKDKRGSKGKKAAPRASASCSSARTWEEEPLIPEEEDAPICRTCKQTLPKKEPKPNRRHPGYDKEHKDG